MPLLIFLVTAAVRWLQEVDRQLAAFEPVELREQVTSSWARERNVQTQDEASALIEDQMPFHFQEPRGAALQEYLRRTAGLARYAPDVIRHFSSQDYGGIDVEDRLGEVRHPVLVLGGRRGSKPQTRPLAGPRRQACRSCRPAVSAALSTRRRAGQSCCAAPLGG